jgi:predicted SprT family Zn-dependent metalloprotease
MKNKRLDLKGTIEEVNILYHGNSSCYGLTDTKGNKFKILISKESIDKSELFIEVLLHELLHLWLYIVEAGYNIHLSGRQHHKVIDKVTPYATKELIKIQKGK